MRSRSDVASTTYLKVKEYLFDSGGTLILASMKGYVR
jgi:hypothetical protein